MPRPRFETLESAKRERILQAAAREFAAQGFDGASMNHILDVAGISKGAAYYYFDNKADLFMTAVSHYGEELMADLSLDVDELMADNFWPALAQQYRTQFEQARRRPWVFGLLKAAGSQTLLQTGPAPLAEFSRQIQSVLRGLLAKGQSLDLIRRDLADDLLFSLVVSIDEAHDRWLLTQWSQMSEQELQDAVQRIIDLLQRLLRPRTDNPSAGNDT